MGENENFIKIDFPWGYLATTYPLTKDEWKRMMNILKSYEQILTEKKDKEENVDRPPEVN